MSESVNARHCHEVVCKNKEMQGKGTIALKVGNLASGRFPPANSDIVNAPNMCTGISPNTACNSCDCRTGIGSTTKTKQQRRQPHPRQNDRKMRDTLATRHELTPEPLPTLRPQGSNNERIHVTASCSSAAAHLPIGRVHMRPTPQTTAGQKADSQSSSLWQGVLSGRQATKRRTGRVRHGEAPRLRLLPERRLAVCPQL